MALTQPHKPPDLQSTQFSTHHSSRMPIFLWLAITSHRKRFDDLAMPFKLTSPDLQLQLLQSPLVNRHINRHVAIQLHDQKLKNAADLVQPLAELCTEIELTST